VPKQRVDPDRIYWMRNEGAPQQPEVAEEDEVSSDSNSSGQGGVSNTGRYGNVARGAGAAVPRPPSYASDDGVSYVVDAQPRSIAPSAIDVPIVMHMHPAEAGRVGRPSAW